MKAEPDDIEEAVDAYNQATSAHKRAPDAGYVRKQLAAGEAVEVVSGHPRWSSALRFSGAPDEMEVEFVVNPALPDRFKKHLEKTKQAFEELLGE